MGPATAPAARWKLSLDAQEGWDSNVLFSAPAGAGDLMTRLAARLDRTWSGRRGRFALSGGGQGSLYRRVSELNHFTYTGDADGSWLASPRTVIRVSDAFRTSYASELAALTGAGLLLPPVISRANTARGGLSYGASRRTTAALDLQHETVSFDSPSLIGGSTLSAGAALSRELSRADTATAGYQYQWSTVEGRHSVTHTLHATWSRALGSSVHTRARLGASRFQPLTTTSFRTTPVGTLGIDGRWGRQSIDARYDRFVDLAYGLGRLRINGLLSARYAVSVTADLVLDVRAVRGRSDDPADPSFALTNTDLAANLRYAVAPGFAVVGSYSRRRSTLAPSPPVSSQGATVFLSYERAWR
ncbi:MAG TPA: hypothetical protein VGN09_18630 [Vicinamibacteria bacterium]